VKYVAVRGHPSLVNAKDVFGMTPFHLACENGDLGIVEYLVRDTIVTLPVPATPSERHFCNAASASNTTRVTRLLRYQCQ
jgi:ankyrin repeat protein